MSFGGLCAAMPRSHSFMNGSLSMPKAWVSSTGKGKRRREGKERKQRRRRIEGKGEGEGKQRKQKEYLGH